MGGSARLANLGAAGIIKGNAAYIEGKGKRAADPTTFMRENGGVETSNRADGGLFFRLLAKAGFVIRAAKYGGISPGFPSSQQRIGSPPTTTVAGVPVPCL